MKIRDYSLYSDQSCSAVLVPCCIASIVAEHYTGNILLKGNQFITKVDYFLGVDRDWIECKDRQLWVEIGSSSASN